MKNILKIFIGDVKRIRKNVIAMIVVIGVLVVVGFLAAGCQARDHQQSKEQRYKLFHLQSFLSFF